MRCHLAWTPRLTSYLPGIDRYVLTSLYALHLLDTGSGPFISIHDGFQAPASWAGFLPGSDRIILDTHPYL
ncbi:hypothetical protein B0H14DRAFT_3461729 [Mycena olivaceomarginata]|nr:hypothetical protein B0H14DRAFT_3461729 [Mycena olivaceomarginata]